MNLKNIKSWQIAGAGMIAQIVLPFLFYPHFDFVGLLAVLGLFLFIGYLCIASLRSNKTRTIGIVLSISFGAIITSIVLYYKDYFFLGVFEGVSLIIAGVHSVFASHAAIREDTIESWQTVGVGTIVLIGLLLRRIMSISNSGGDELGVAIGLLYLLIVFLIGGMWTTLLYGRTRKKERVQD